MSGPVTRTAFIDALRALEPQLVPEYERARTRDAVRLVIDRALTAYRAQVKRCHPDQGGDPKDLMKLVRHRDAIYLARDTLPLPLVQPDEFDRSMRAASMSLVINGVPVDVRHSFRHRF